MIEVPQEFKPTINTVYPPSNFYEFERWFGDNYKENLEREYLGIYWCAYQVNNSYGQDMQAMYRLQQFVDSLPRDKKYFTIVQYDDSCGVNFKDLDIVTFGMSYRLPEQKPTYVIPLIGQMGDRLIREKKYKASFIGTKTHPIRDEIVSILSGKKEYFVSTEPFRPQDYFEIMAESEFTICPRGYGIPSFRAFESIHNYSIPIYVSDDFIEPYGIDFNEYGVKVHDSAVKLLPEIINSISDYSIKQKLKKAEELYPILCTYEGVLSKIIETLKSES